MIRKVFFVLWAAVGGCYASAPSKLLPPPTMAGPASELSSHGSNGGSPSKANRSPWQVGDIVQLPYMENRVYRAKAYLGDPVIIELPAGEVADKVWLDEQHFQTMGNRRTNRVVVSPRPMDGVEGRRTFVHIETVPSGLRVSFLLEAVPDPAPGEDMIPGVYQVFATSDMMEKFQARQIESQVATTVEAVKDDVQSKAKSEVASWKAETLAKLDEKYTCSGNIPVDRVVSDGVQTFIITTTQEKGTVMLKNKDGKEEALNFRIDNGTYTVDRVLVPGEKFVLSIGNAQTVVKRR